MRRALLIALGLSLAASLFVGLHGYLAQRLILEPELPDSWRRFLLGGLVALAVSIALTPLAERLLPPRWSRLIAWPASLWMGFMFLLLVLLAASDMVIWFLGDAAVAFVGARPAAAANVRALAAVGIALVAGAAGVRSAMRPPRLRRVEIPLARWPESLDGFRIVQISDIHIGPLLDRRFAEQVVSRVNALAPDLVAVTGDLVDGGVRQLARDVEPFGGLRARHGVYFVTGNHDHYSGADSWVSHIRSLGLRPLRNERVCIRVGEAAFDLIGVDDHRGDWRDGGGEDLPRAVEGRDSTRPAVLLAHDPSTFERASKLGVDLQLSGHTHGGQIWPFGLLVRLVIPFVAGRYAKNGAELYVSRGTGFWGPPMRIFAPAEITEITLIRAIQCRRAMSGRPPRRVWGLPRRMQSRTGDAPDAQQAEVEQKERMR